MVDIEADGPIPSETDYSMIEIGAVVVEPSLSKTFHGKLRPISDRWLPDALGVSGWTREQTLEFDDPTTVMCDFKEWIKENSKGKPYFVADNNGFDYMFTAWYFHHFVGQNPFGWSSTNLGSLIKGMNKDMWYRWKHMRETVHDHSPVNDAKGNAEVMLKLKNDFGLKAKLV